MKKQTYQTRKQRARAKAIDLQIKNFNYCQSWEEVNQNSDMLYRLAKQYGLIKEFKNEGIL